MLDLEYNYPQKLPVQFFCIHSSKKVSYLKMLIENQFCVIPQKQNPTCKIQDASETVLKNLSHMRSVLT